MSMDRQEQFKMKGVQGFFSCESKSTEKSLNCYLAPQLIAHHYSGLDWNLDYPEIKVVLSEKKRLKSSCWTESIEKSFLSISGMMHAIDVNPQLALLYNDMEVLPSEDAHAFRFAGLNPSSVSVESERLKSQLIATQRAQMVAQKSVVHLMVENARLMEANKTLKLALGLVENADIYLREVHCGTVSETVNDQVEVTYEMANGPLKQIYSKKQFIQGKSPKEGDDIEALVMFAVIDRRANETKETDLVNDLPSFREKAESGPIHL